MPDGKPSRGKKPCRAEGPDPLQTGRRLLAAALFGCAVCAAGTLAALRLPDFSQALLRQRSLVSFLALSDLSVVPSGRTLRQPATLNAAVPLRFTPWLDGREPEPAGLLALDEAVDALERHDARKHEVVMLRTFAGLGSAETAEVLDLSPATVERDWSYAKAWLRRRMGAGGA